MKVGVKIYFFIHSVDIFANKPVSQRPIIIFPLKSSRIVDNFKHFYIINYADRSTSCLHSTCFSYICGPDLRKFRVSFRLLIKDFFFTNVVECWSSRISLQSRRQPN